MGSKIENLIQGFQERRTLCFSSYKRRKLKVKLWRVGAREKKKNVFFVPFILSKGNAFNIVFFLNIEFIEYAFRIYMLLDFKKHYFIHFFCLLLKSSNAFSVSLMF